MDGTFVAAVALASLCIATGPRPAPAPRGSYLPEDGHQLDCPPTPPPPVAEPARCGNGKVDVSYELISASCIPGSCCASGWAPRPLEECDGADLGGRSCASVGHRGGTLACTAGCRIDATRCEQTPRARAPGDAVRLEAAATRPGAIVGGGPALALNGSTLGLVVAAGGALRFRTFDAGTLAPLGPPRDSAPLFADSEPSRATSRALLAPLRDGFVAAVGQVSSTFLVRLGPGRPDEVGERPSVGLPLFLVAGWEGALLGLEPHQSGYPVQLVHLDRGGSPDWRPVTAVEAARPAFGNPAAAAAVGGEWLVASGSRAPPGADPLPTGLFAARVSPRGVVRSASWLVPATGSVAIASEGDRAVIVHVTPGGVRALDVSASAPVPPLLLADARDHRFERVLAAQLRDGVLTALVAGATPGRGGVGEGVGTVYRLRARLPAEVAAPELVFSAPGLVPGAGLLADGRMYLVIGDAAGAQTLWTGAEAR